MRGISMDEERIIKLISQWILQVHNLQGWEFNHRFFNPIARLLWSKDQFDCEEDQIAQLIFLKINESKLITSIFKKDQRAKIDVSDLLFWHKKGDLQIACWEPFDTVDLFQRSTRVKEIRTKDWKIEFPTLTISEYSRRFFTLNIWRGCEIQIWSDFLLKDMNPKTL